MTNTTIPMSFRLVSLQPDKRQYKTAMPLLEPFAEMYVVIDVPLNHTYIYNSERIIMQQMNFDQADENPMLTPKGLAYIESVLLDRIDEPEKTKKTDDEEIEWEVEEN